MKKLLHLLRRDDGAELIEATLIYPFVFMVIFGVIYMGLFLLQNITVSAYAQKVALLAAREVAYPGYINLISRDKYESGAVEVELSDYTKSLTDDANTEEGTKLVISIPNDAKEVHARAYRYWRSDPLDATLGEDYDAKGILSEILSNMVANNSILINKGETIVTIQCQNKIVAQYVTVNVDQQLQGTQLLKALGVENPSVHVAVKVAANDTDEFIRTTDFVCDALKMIAKKLNIDIDSVRDKLEKAKEKIGLN